jgi:uncharacterized membrane protein YcaP (DUF421 family)
MQRRVRDPAAYLLVVFLGVFPVLAASGFRSERAQTTALNVALVFGVLLVVFRLIGKRELGRLSPFEFVTLMLVPEIVSELLQGNGDVPAALIGLSTLFGLVLIVSFLSHRFPHFQRLVEASPTLLVADGQILERRLNEERITPDEVVAEMHKQGIESISEVKWAILEASGNITFIPKLPPASSSSGVPHDWQRSLPTLLSQTQASQRGDLAPSE